jgi:tetratricopeptide (TPR) repeat protein
MIQKAIFLFIILSSINLSQDRSSDSSFFSIPLKDFNGETVLLDTIIGEKITAIVFWATWSRDSGMMLNIMQEFYERYHKNGLQVLSICVEQEKISDSSIVIIKNILDKQQITYIKLCDNGLKMFRVHNLIAVPTTIILDSSKKIIAHISGYSLSTKSQIIAIINQNINRHSKKNTQYTEHVPLKEAIRYYNMAMMDYKKGKIQNSKEYANKAFINDSLFNKPITLLAEIAIEEERWNEAKDLIEKGIKMDSIFTPNLLLNSILLIHDGKNSEAKNLLMDIIKKDSINTLALAQYAYIIGLEGKVVESMQWFSKAELLDPKESRIFKYRMKVNKLIGNSEFLKKDSLKIRSLTKF